MGILLLSPLISTGLKCAPEQFHCLNTMSNTILSINDWNREGETCIDGSLRCDGRHDCQDGLDEHECRFESPQIPRHFWCYQGTRNRFLPSDCLAREEIAGPISHDSIRTSVSETEEWVCSKTEHNNGTVTRGCEKTYTGGESFSTCYWSSEA